MEICLNWCVCHPSLPKRRCAALRAHTHTHTTVVRGLETDVCLWMWESTCAQEHVCCICGGGGLFDLLIAIYKHVSDFLFETNVQLHIEVKGHHCVLSIITRIQQLGCSKHKHVSYNTFVAGWDTLTNFTRQLMHRVNERFSGSGGYQSSS